MNGQAASGLSAGGQPIENRLIITTDSSAANATIALEGELDLATAPRLQRAVGQVDPRGLGYVVLDLRGVTFTDAAGLRAIASAGRTLGARLIVCGPQPPVRRVIQITHLDDVVQVQDAGAPELSDTPATNAAYVRHLCRAYAEGGAEQFASLVPDDVEWKSAWSGGRVLHGTDELLEFWSSRPGVKVTPDALTAVGDDVLVTWRVESDGPREIWSLYRFAGRRLVQAVSFDREVDAIAALQLARRG